jgi:hypothetical protein
VNSKRTSYSRSSALECVEELLGSLIQDQMLFLMPVSSQGSFLFMRTCQTVMVMLIHLVPVKVGVAS